MIAAPERIARTENRARYHASNKDPERLSFLSFGGAKQHNMAKVYSGPREVNGRVVPRIVFPSAVGRQRKLMVNATRERCSYC